MFELKFWKLVGSSNAEIEQKCVTDANNEMYIFNGGGAEVVRKI